MATLNQLTEQTLGEVNSYVKNQESVTVITSATTAGDATMLVDDATALSKGIVEIDDELVYLKKIIPTSGTIQVLGTTGNIIGRGWRGTTATSHVVGSVVRNALEDITGISWDVPDSTGVWQIIKNYRVDKIYYDTDTSTIKQALILKESPMPGRTVNVQYTKFPTVITDNQELTASGLPASCEDVVRLGAMYRLLTTVDPGKVTATTVSADALDQPVQAGASTNAAKYLFQLYTVRLAEEIAKQQANFLNTIQYTR